MERLIMGRQRKPFIEKSTTLMVHIPNKKVMEMLEKMNEEIEEPKFVFDYETMRKLSTQVTQLIEDYLEDTKLKN